MIEGTIIHVDEVLRPAFWDVPFETLSWEEHRDFIIRRILQSGTFEMIRWLRTRLDDDALREWLKEHRGRGLSPRQIHYWKAVLGLSPGMVDHWITAQEQVWGRR
jgi:hypothetical protein